jgi:hypothetical protein
MEIPVEHAPGSRWSSESATIWKVGLAQVRCADGNPAVAVVLQRHGLVVKDTPGQQSRPQPRLAGKDLGQE